LGVGLGTVLRLLPPTLPMPSMPLPGPRLLAGCAAPSSPPLVASSPLVAPALSSGDGLRYDFLIDDLRAAADALLEAEVDVESAEAVGVDGAVS